MVYLCKINVRVCVYAIQKKQLKRVLMHVMKIHFSTPILRIDILSTICFLCLFITSCAQSSEGEQAPLSENAPVPVSFSTTIGAQKQTRTTYPTAGEGGMTNDRLKQLSFGVFAQYTGTDLWTAYTETTPFNFMWNQKVDWNDPNWTYTPVKYWPNDNQPADDKGAQGSVAHSYLSFFAYAPFVQAADLPGTGAGNDGIIGMTLNSVNVENSYLYYRTSIAKPFDADESVDLLWATKQDCYKYDGTDDSADDGRVADRVPLLFKHALTKLEIKVRALIDQTGSYSSDAYSTVINENSKLFVETVDITTPPYYSEGKLMLAPGSTDISWSYPSPDFDPYQKDGFHFDNTTGNGVDDVSYSIRWNGKPTDRSTPEEAKDDFDALLTGVTDDEELQLPADYPMYMFPPTTTQSDITVRTKYYVVTYDPQLTLNNPKYYSIVKNDITASLGDSDFQFEPNKQYKILLNLGLTSVKFDVYVLDDSGEYILLSSVVKEWDLKTIEVNVE